MENIVLISKIQNYIDKNVVLNGWVYNFRSSGSLIFLQLRDGSGFIQCILNKKDVSEKIWELASQITQESSVKITGKVVAHPKQTDVYEIHIIDLFVYQIAQEYPISNKEHGADFLLDNRHLWLRSKRQWAIQRVRNTIINAIYEYFNNNGFIKIDSPILTPNACEGTTELFEMDYFDDKKAYLSQSGQLYIEAGIMSHGRVFDFGPVFRAEKSKTRRHLTEFWMMDAEMAFCDYEQNMDIQEGLVKHCLKCVLEKNQNEFIILERDTKLLEQIKGPFPRKTHTETVLELREMGSDIKEDDDLGGDDETILMNKYKTPVFIQKYPAKVKAFYMKRDPQNELFALCADLLAPEGYGEIIGGSQREDDYDTLVLRIKEHNLKPETFAWYLDLRKYGSVPHSGFGIGLERMVAWVCGLKHIRETIPFPRTINRLWP